MADMRLPIPTWFLLFAPMSLTFACGGESSDEDGNSSSSSSSGEATSSSGGSSSGEATSSSGGSSSGEASSSSGGGQNPLYQAAQAVMNQSCVGCHNAGNPSADFDASDLSLAVDKASSKLSARVLVIAGNSQESLLVELMRGPVAGMEQMPPGGAAALSAEQIKAVADWIDAGANN